MFLFKDGERTGGKMESTARGRAKRDECLRATLSFKNWRKIC